MAFADMSYIAERADPEYTRPSLVSIILPNGITNIGYKAFIGCRYLTSISIPNSVTSIENFVFSGCTSLTNISIPSSVTSIGYDAFYGCRLNKLHIPKSLERLETSAVYGQLAEITVEQDNDNFIIDDGVLYSRDRSVLFYYPHF